MLLGRRAMDSSTNTPADPATPPLMPRAGSAAARSAALAATARAAVSAAQGGGHGLAAEQQGNAADNDAPYLQVRQSGDAAFGVPA